MTGEVRDYLRANVVMSKGGQYVTAWLEEKRKTAKVDFAPEFATILGDQTKLGALPPAAKPGEVPAGTAPVVVPTPETSAPTTAQ